MNRRTFLRGIGVAAALPVVPAGVMGYGRGGEPVPQCCDRDEPFVVVLTIDKSLLPRHAELVGKVNALPVTASGRACPPGTLLLTGLDVQYHVSFCDDGPCAIRLLFLYRLRGWNAGADMYGTARFWFLHEG